MGRMQSIPGVSMVTNEDLALADQLDMVERAEEVSE